jgi:hypothetical protein
MKGLVMNNAGRTVLSILFGAICLLGGSKIALGCTCDLPQKAKSLKQQVAEARAKSSVIFVGEVVEVMSDPQLFHVKVKFKVERSWKQAKVTVLTIRTGRGNGDCGYHFTTGERYVVYAFGSNESELETNICQRTRSLADAKDDIRLLGKTNPR